MAKSDEEMLDISDSDSDVYEDRPRKIITTKKAPTAKKKAAPKLNTKAKKKPFGLTDVNLTVAGDDEGDSDDYAESKPIKAKASGGYNEKRTIEEIYQKKTQLEHILLRPDTYVGSVEPLKQQLWVYDSETTSMKYRAITVVPGLYKIVDEILVNAADNKIRDPNMDTLKVTVDRENNVISVYNNGCGIPVEIHKEEKIFVPELIFGHLLTSSNYDDNEKKVTGGRNGYGAKLCNIFSTEFTVETADRERGKRYKQTFRDNMSRKEEPKISPNPKNEEYTRITFKPDLAKFGMTHMDDDFEALIKKRVYDMAGCVAGVKVFLNDERIKIKDFKQYVELYVNSAQIGNDISGKPLIVHEKVNDRWEISFVLSDGQFQQVSFVNSICTSKGGTHVNYIADQIVNRLVEAVKKKNKAAPLKPFQVKNHLWVFVNCLIENPAFDSQTKESMTLRASAFGSKCTVSEEFMKKVMKSGVVESILSFAKFKQDQLLKRTDGHKRSRITGIVKLEDANNAGTRNSHGCTLILCEGDSAKSLVVSGLGVVGRENYGVFPLRGKLLNVREAAHKQIMDNAEISHLKQILGLQHGKVYDSVEGLRYGHVMIMTDQDHDGSHIKGLIINFLDRFYPSLLKIPGFLHEFITPIVKATHKRRNEVISFFTLPEYETWKQENEGGKNYKIKYYKGLGTNDNEDAIEYFSNLALHRKPFHVLEDSDSELIDMAFSKKKADNRKEWLRQYRPGTFIDHSVKEIRISDFINRELILFSMADNIRSIPSVVDGFKPGQRKILFSMFKKKAKAEIKVAQLSGYVSAESAYHHGEQSLAATIIGMAQTFVGSNNINLLQPKGQFGSRHGASRDAASARYTFTLLSSITRIIFNPDDDALLDYLEEDGDSIEPQWYIPILPMVLVNGSEGIGTGWSSSIPNYNPKDIVDNIRRLMRGEELVPMTPWYRGFTGLIEKLDKDKYKVSGIVNVTDETTIEITELPVRTWTNSFKEQLERWSEGTEMSPAFIKDIKEYHNDSSVHFVIKMSEDQIRKAEDEGLEKRFKLTSQFSTSNMVCFDMAGRIRKYNSAEEILTEFYDLRLTYYQKRKEYLSNLLRDDREMLDNRVRFISMIIEGKLVVQNRKKKDILIDLKANGFRPFSPKKNANMGDNDEENEEDIEDAKENSQRGYDYLLSMPIWSLTIEKVEKLLQERNDKDVAIAEHLRKTPKDLWNRDLDAFVKEWENILCKNKQSRLHGRQEIGKPKTKTAVARRKPKSSNDEGKGDDDILMFEDNDADFAPTKSKAMATKPVVAKNRKVPIARKEKIKDTPAIPAMKQTSIASFVKKADKTQYDEIDSDDSLEMSLKDKLEEFANAKLSKKEELFHPRSPVAKDKTAIDGMDSPVHKRKRTINVELLSDQLSDINIDNDGESPKTTKPQGKSLFKKFVESKSKPDSMKAPEITTKKFVANSRSKRPMFSDSDDDDVAEVTASSPQESYQGAKAKNIKSKHVSADDYALWDIPAPLPLKVNPVKKEPVKASGKITVKTSTKKKAAAIFSDDDDSQDDSGGEIVSSAEPRGSRPVRVAARAAVKKPQYIELSDEDQADDVFVDDSSDFESDDD